MRKDIEVRDNDTVPVARKEPASLAPLAPQLQPLQGMFSFRYSSTEVYSQDGHMHVRMKQTEYQDGRLRSEECEGRLDQAAAERMMLQAQQQFLSQAFGFARLLLAPFLSRRG